MKRIALIAVLVGIALVVNAQEQGKEVKLSPTTSPEKPGSVSLQPGTTTEAPKKTEKPYGCYKELKWGMSFEQAQSSLGFTMKKRTALIGPEKGNFSGQGKITIDDKIYSLILVFDSTGLLHRVHIDPSYNTPPIGFGGLDPTLQIRRKLYFEQQAKIWIDAYFLFRPTLEEKFGKPIKESAQDKGSDVALFDNLLAHQAIFSSTWETEESNITLTAEFKEVVGEGLMPAFYPFLVYEKKSVVPKAKVDL